MNLQLQLFYSSIGHIQDNPEGYATAIAPATELALPAAKAPCNHMSIGYMQETGGKPVCDAGALANVHLCGRHVVQCLSFTI